MKAPPSIYTGLIVVIVLGQLLGSAVEAESPPRQYRAYEEASHIQKTLFVNYDKHVRPQPNATVPVLVRMVVTVDHIHYLDQDSLYTILSITLKWTDKRLSWDPSNLQNIYTTKSKVWTPSLYLLNSIEPLKYLQDFGIVLGHQGDLVWQRKVEANTLCPADNGDRTYNCSYLFASSPFRSSEEQLQLMQFSVSDTATNYYLNVSQHTEFNSTRSPSHSDTTLTSVPTAVGTIRLTGVSNSHYNKGFKSSTSVSVMLLALVSFVVLAN
ncbi:acetylcholine receptor subunit beta-like [Argonauta hians]